VNWDNLDPDPLRTVAAWYALAKERGVVEPEAMTLATADAEGRPSARIVLMRGLGPEGVDFFTNYGSRKGLELTGNPHAAIVLYWEPLGRQVRIEGEVVRLSREASADYFAGRPRGSQLAAWASEQSRPLSDRETLERRVAAAEVEHADEVPLPPFWGGFRVLPDMIELWSAGEFRMHDRFAYRRTAAGWEGRRLFP